MDRKLFEATQAGNVQSLHQLLGENPLILHTSALTSAENPLHVASAYGHIDFVKEIINLRPDMAQEVNQDGFSPMHMASSIGHTEVVRELLKVDRKLCQLQGPEAKTPLHCAAIKGRSHAVAEMLSACPECVEDVTIQHYTALHLAIKSSQYGVIAIIVDWIREMKKEHIFNMRDEQGNTVLHLATLKKQRQVIELLLGHQANASQGLEVNAINHSGLTAIDLLLIFPSEAGDREIEEILRSAGATGMGDDNQTSTGNPPASSAETNPLQTKNDVTEYFKFKKGRDSPGETRSSLLVVAALVATTTFQFGVNPPGGAWQDNSIPTSKTHIAGESIWGSTNTIAFRLYMFFNSLGFKLSLQMINILTTKFPLQFELQLCFLAMNFTYDTAVISIAPDGVKLFVILTISILPVAIGLAAYGFRLQRKRRRSERTATVEPQNQ
ncbi:ANK REP REGION domain-containing protein [Citrus sinensis]|uniref:ANK REP REGION domain-containing protein n=1 Tax=Citrus sinensis TaxID=2711 RepID=A0ACB8LAW8_CITSI|nr:ANK REP REGION domain-containing protein [Citrus sinensis]